MLTLFPRRLLDGAPHRGIRISFPSALYKASAWGRIRAGRLRLGATIGRAHGVEGAVQGAFWQITELPHYPRRNLSGSLRAQ